MLKLLYTTCFLLIILGVGAWASAGFSPESKTALIPSGIGSLMLICALFTKMSRPIGMHAAIVVALIGISGSFMKPLKPLLQGNFDLSGRSAQVSLAMDLLLIIFIVASVRSFIAARRARTLEP